MSSLNAVLPLLQQRFETQRLVFWHDPDGEYSTEVDALDLPGVTTLRVNNDEYALKHRVLRDEPNTNFLIYREGPAPADTRNCLLDLELAYGTFAADRIALVCQELELTGAETNAVVHDHEKFFRSMERSQKLKRLLTADDDADKLRAKMCAVLLEQSEHSMLELTRTLLIEHAIGNDGKYRALTKQGLDNFHWAGVAKIYGYKSKEPSIDDFVLWMFRHAINGFAADTPDALRNIQLDFASLRNDRRSSDALATLARRVSESLNYASSIKDAELVDLVRNDLFEDVERKIISMLAEAVVGQTMSARAVSETIRARQNSLWFDEYRKLYTALGAASELFSELSTARFEITSFDEGLEHYRNSWFRIDQLYRQFHFAARMAEHADLLGTLQGKVEKHYTNQYLYKLGNSWQQQVDTVRDWRSVRLRPQSKFFTDHVEPIIRKGNRKAVVIISDALRYEIADELRSRIRQEDRFDAELDAMLGVLPSYTQLGMAALLPHKTLAHSHDGDPVLVDGQRSDGTKNRTKVLKAVNGLAIRADEVLSKRSNELRELYGAHQVLYVYHDRIDAVGDEPRTERQVFEAAHDTLRDLVDLIKRLTNANATNIIVTADHGFLYQDTDLADTYYLSATPQGDDLVAKNRRYVLGQGLKDDPAFRKFEPKQLGLGSDLEVQIPKSIHRLRLPGAGSRFVHGGASLQEIVVPVLTVHKKRKSDTRPVNVEVLHERDKITTGQLVVKLLQSEPVSDKVQSRTLRAGVYFGETLISSQPELVFDQTSEDKRERCQSAHLLLSQDANEFNNRMVEFRLEEQIPGTTQWRTYQQAPYLLKRSFTSDFDF